MAGHARTAAIEEAHALLARTIGEEIELVVVSSPEPLMICADSGQIQQVLINLAVNALMPMSARLRPVWTAE